MKHATLKIAILTIFLTNCSQTKFVVHNLNNEEIGISYSGNRLGSIKPGKTLEITDHATPPIAISNNHPETGYYILFSKQKTDSTSLYCKDKTDNVRINEHKLSKENGKTFELIDISILNKSQATKPGTTEGYGYLKLTSNEDKVEIYLDGENIGLISNNSLNKKISSGKHSLMAKKEFFMPVTIKFEIQDKDIFPYNFELKTVKGWIEEEPGQSVTIQARGNLTVVTEKSDFMVYIEGVAKEPPFELKDMPAGKYNLKISCSEFTKNIEITVPDGETQFIDLDDLFPR